MEQIELRVLATIWRNQEGRLYVKYYFGEEAMTASGLYNRRADHRPLFAVWLTKRVSVRDIEVREFEAEVVEEHTEPRAQW